MGLDMYLTKRNATARDEQDEMVAYWRKANHIHGWFERNVAYGELENCEPYPVSFEQLMSLGITCQLVKANPESAPVLLPRQEGFFFGSSEYDDDYFMDVDETPRNHPQGLRCAPGRRRALLPRLVVEANIACNSPNPKPYNIVRFWCTIRM